MAAKRKSARVKAKSSPTRPTKKPTRATKKPTRATKPSSPTRATKPSSPTKATKKPSSSWAAFDRAAARAIAGFRLGSLTAGQRDVARAGLAVPADLLRLVVSVDDGSRIDLSALGGAAHQELFDVSGLLDADQPEGLLMFGYGPTQLLYDTDGTLGAPGSVWACEDQDVTDAKQLAGSLRSLLEGAAPAVEPVVAPRPAPKKRAPPPFRAPPEAKGLFEVVSEAPGLDFVLRHGNALWFHDEGAPPSAFNLETASWATLSALPGEFVAPAFVSLRDGSVLLVEWDFTAGGFLCARGDGTSWKKAATLPCERRLVAFGQGVEADGRVVLVGGTAAGSATDRCWLYSPTSDAWAAGPPLPAAMTVERTLPTQRGVHFLVNDPETSRPKVLTLVSRRWHEAWSDDLTTTFDVASLRDGRQALVVNEERRAAACLVFDPRGRTLSALPALPVCSSTGPACEVAEGVLGAIRGLQSKREFVALLNLAQGGWVAGPLLPRGTRTRVVAQHGDRVFFFCLREQPTRAREVLVASAEALRSHAQPA